MDIAAILQEVAQTLTTTGVSVYTSIPDAGEYPAIVVNPPNQITYQVTLGNGCELQVPLTLYVQTSDLASAWEMVYALLSFDTAATPIPDALLSHTPTNYRQLQVTTASNFRPSGESGIAVDVNLTIHT